MNQTGWIAAFIFVGFFVYITVRGQLPAFQDAIFHGAATVSPATVKTVTEAGTQSGLDSTTPAQATGLNW